MKLLIKIILYVIALVALILTGSAKETVMRDTMMFGTYAESAEQFSHALILVKSLRAFGGNMKNIPVQVFIPEVFQGQWQETHSALTGLDVRVIPLAEPPRNAVQFYYARKVFAAAEAERRAAGTTRILVWMDADTVVLQEPEVFSLPDYVVFGYRPVMHNRVDAAADTPPSPFWQTVYDALGVRDDMMFTMTTPADAVNIRPYFNAGILVVRPENGIFQRWETCFRVLYSHPGLIEMAQQNVEYRIFLHQAALVGAVLPHCPRNQLLELPDTVNYPLFFDRMFEATRRFETLDDRITIRYDLFFRQPDPGWDQKLQGDPERIQWLKEHMASLYPVAAH